jgi:transcriptional regulator with XRE-family HTH domain
VQGSRTDDEADWLAAMGLRLKLVRTARGLSQQQLADASGLSRVYIGAVERGAHGVNVIVLRPLASALDVRMSALMVEDGEMATRLALC